MKYRIGSLAALLIIGLVSSASALAGPRNHQGDHGYRSSSQRSAPPARQARSAPPQQVRSAPPARQVRSAPPARQVRSAPPARQVRSAPPARQVHRAPPARQVHRAPPPTLEELCLPPVLKDIALSTRGLVIFVGGTGTGKTTSLAAMVNYRNENSHGHIITIEDPIEFIHEHKNCIIEQREVGIDTDSWEVALKNTLRQAPDVILMGEIRDRETMDYAIAFAETGHLALATLHANSTNQAVDRIVNFFPEQRRAQLLMDLSLNIRAMVSQRLLPVRNSKGRIPAVEIMLNSPLISDLIFKGNIPEIRDVIKRSREEGMQTFDQALFDLYEAELITYEDALRNADSLNDLRLQIKLNSKHSDPGALTDNIRNLGVV